MKEVKIVQLLNALPILRELAKTPLPMETSYNVRRVIDEVNIATSAYETRRNGIVEDFMEDGSIPPAKMDAFNAKNEELMNEKVPLDIPEVFLDEFGDHFVIEPANVTLIEWFVRVSE